MTTLQIADEVREGVLELEATFPDATVTVEPTGDGGAWITVDPVPLGAPYAQVETWVRFQLVFTYPAADVYPLFVRPDLSRSDGAALGEGLQQAIGCGPSGTILATQLSRRTNTLDGSTNSAVGKLLKVLQWLHTR